MFKAAYPEISALEWRAGGDDGGSKQQLVWHETAPCERSPDVELSEASTIDSTRKIADLPHHHIPHTHPKFLQDALLSSHQNLKRTDTVPQKKEVLAAQVLRFMEIRNSTESYRNDFQCCFSRPASGFICSTSSGHQSRQFNWVFIVKPLKLSSL
ncbi:hypothetical protein CEXT_563781 [Caerostris extrusa]|uniref:Uncharacterized protein n=1 Tax=Caerostris extrusa TaxID=172846 RepID=A0AAV4SY02_CAEEX|nr:hypothetical protein CEXT_563781 [Caerostris extrusa]